MQMTSERANTEATMAAQTTEITELKRQLDISAKEQSRLSELNVEQNATIDGLRQQLAELKAEHELTTNQLSDSQASVSQLQASRVFAYSYCLIVHSCQFCHRFLFTKLVLLMYMNVPNSI